MSPRTIAIVAALLLSACRPGATTPPSDAPATDTATKPDAPADPDTMYFAGSVAVPGMELAYAIELVRAGGSYTGKITIPSQGVRDVPLADVVVTSKAISFAIAQVGAKWSVTRDAAGAPDVCKFEQGPAKLDCGMARIDAAKYAALSTPARPQEPKPPFDYDVVEVGYDNAAAKVKLAGTLTVPKGDGPFPAVLLVTGSGAQDRDETIFGHKPFWVIADHFAKNGIATLRVDDRGVGGSTGDPKLATTEDFVEDALAGVTFLAGQQRIDPKRVGIVGHSEGGLIGPAAAVRGKQVRFVVMLAGPGVSGAELMPRQVERVLQSAGAPPAEVEVAVAQQRELIAILGKEKDDAAARTKMLEVLGKTPGVDVKELAPEVDALLSPWFRNFIAFDPKPTLGKVKVPVLALVGDLDVQVDAEQNATALTKALKKNKRAEVRRMPGLNHMFQHAKTGSVAEYGSIEETMSPEVLALMTEWIAKR